MQNCTPCLACPFGNNRIPQDSGLKRICLRCKVGFRKSKSKGERLFNIMAPCFKGPSHMSYSCCWWAVGVQCCMNSFQDCGPQFVHLIKETQPKVTDSQQLSCVLGGHPPLPLIQVALAALDCILAAGNSGARFPFVYAQLSPECMDALRQNNLCKSDGHIRILDTVGCGRLRKRRTTLQDNFQIP